VPMRARASSFAGLVLIALTAAPVAGGPPDAAAPPAAAKQPALPGLVPLIPQPKTNAGCWPKHREVTKHGQVWCEPLVQEQFGQNLVQHETEYRDCTKSSAMTMFTCLKVEIGAEGQAAAQCVKCERMPDHATGYRWLKERDWTDKRSQGPSRPTKSCTCAARIVSRFKFAPSLAGEVFLVPPVVMRGKP
jgi:hypothetical protein